ncbi:MAG: putative histidine kinase with motif [Gammaproteobacteria bacterium]|jgi:two-component system CheB/CheR fusion protein|nr:putative histidine kinase with motif [Gammaproteobacteria bacterium]
MVGEVKQTAAVGADGSAPGEGLDERRRREQSYLFEHRRQIRGLLAMIRAIIRRTARSDQSAEEYAGLLEGRLGALARVQDMLMRVPDAGADLMELASAEFLAQGVPEDRVTLAGPSIPLPGHVAASLALALHELTTNAIKFGALSAAHGRVEVAWAENERDGFLRLEWREAGVPVLLTTPRTHGFGVELLENTLPYELGARTSVEFAPGGLVCVIEFRPRKG